MNAIAMTPRQPVRHPPSKPLRLAAPSWAEHPSVMAPAGWHSRMRSLRRRAGTLLVQVEISCRIAEPLLKGAVGILCDQPPCVL